MPQAALQAHDCSSQQTCSACNVPALNLIAPHHPISLESSPNQRSAHQYRFLRAVHTESER
jgi:hypothetical protein